MNILISGLPIRKKYIKAYGGIEAFNFFDLVVDATPALVEGYKKENYDDEVFLGSEKVVVLKSVDEILSILNKKVNNAVFFNMRCNKLELKLIKLLRVKKAKIHLLQNKSVARNPRLLFNPLAFIRVNLINFICILIAKIGFSRIDVLYTSSSFFSFRKLIYFLPKKIVRVKHFDVVGFSDDKLQNNDVSGVFVDQYLPFHTEGIDGREKLNPEEYYNKISEFMLFMKDKFNLDQIYFARHPNSTGKELRYLTGFKVCMGETTSVISKCEYVFGHYSNAINQAFLLNKNVYLVYLDVLPAYRTLNIDNVVDKVGYKSIRFNGDGVVSFQDPLVKRTFSYYGYRVFYGMSKPDFLCAFKRQVQN